MVDIVPLFAVQKKDVVPLIVTPLIAVNVILLQNAQVFSCMYVFSLVLLMGDYFGTIMYSVRWITIYNCVSTLSTK